MWCSIASMVGNDTASSESGSKSVEDGSSKMPSAKTVFALLGFLVELFEHSLVLDLLLFVVKFKGLVELAEPVYPPR